MDASHKARRDIRRIAMPVKVPADQKAAGCVNFSGTQSGTAIPAEYRHFARPIPKLSNLRSS